MEHKRKAGDGADVKVEILADHGTATLIRCCVGFENRIDELVQGSGRPIGAGWLESETTTHKGMCGAPRKRIRNFRR